MMNLKGYGDKEELAMQYRNLVGSGLLVSPLCLGTMLFGDPVTKEDATRIVDWAVDHEINFMDTANSYEGYSRTVGSPGGISEEILGAAMRGKRDRLIVVSKAGNAVGPGPNDRGLSRGHIMDEVEKSLTRLRTDYLDLYLMHQPDRLVPVEESLWAFDDLVRQGKVRYVGVSNFSACGICETLWKGEVNGWSRIVVAQLRYNLLDRGIEEEQMPFCVREGIGIMAYQPLSGGFLTDKYAKGRPAPPGSRGSEKAAWVQADDGMFDRMERLRALAKEAGWPLAQYALAWVLARPAVSAVVVGARRVDQLEENLRALERVFPTEHQSRIDKISPTPPQREDPVRGHISGSL